MPTLTVTAKGQVTLRKELLRHLGVEPGQRVEVLPLPNGRVEVKAARPQGQVKDLFGLLAGKTNKKATLEEIDKAIAKGWAGRK